MSLPSSMSSEITRFNDGLKAFLQASPTPFHAVHEMSALLLAAGFQPLNLAERWQLAPGQSYFVTRNDSSIIAFRTGEAPLVDKGLRMVGAHTDSPCLKVKPLPEITRQGYVQLGVEVYGGVLMNPWFDRDLSIAGRVNYVDQSGEMKAALLDFRRPVAVIPSLAIHLDKEANQNRSVNAQNHLPPILLQQQGDQRFDFRALLLEQLKAQGFQQASKVLDYELCFYDTQPPSAVGVNEEFMASARLDNLLSCYVGLQSLIAASGEQSALLYCSDHEEVGSASTSGAQGPFLLSVLERLCEQLGPAEQLANERFRRMLEHSMMISADNAHGIHPNYADKHDAQHGPLLNRGPVIKINANQRYATNSETSSLFRHWCEVLDVPVQAFVVRSDQGCGSTIGPAIATELGVRTLDVGLPTFAMHSIRELAGVHDAVHLQRVLTHYFNR